MNSTTPRADDAAVRNYFAICLGGLALLFSREALGSFLLFDAGVRLASVLLDSIWQVQDRGI